MDYFAVTLLVHPQSLLIHQTLYQFAVPNQLKDLQIQNLNEIQQRNLLGIQRVRAAKEEAFRKEKEEQEKLREEYEETATSYLSFIPSLDAVGKAIVEQTGVLKALGNIALQVTADIVRAIGERLLAQAALLYAEAFFTFGASIPSAIAATAGAAAAFVGAGAIEANIGKYTEGGVVPTFPGVPSNGDRVLVRVNPGEEILREDNPRHINNAQGVGNFTINQYNTLNTDSRANLEKAARVLYPFMEEERRRVSGG